MPTKVQCEELINKTTNTWTTMNGVKGYKFTNKSDSNKYIFLPACGYWVNTTYDSAGSFGFYWDTIWNSQTAYHLRFSSGTIRMTTNLRYLGMSIRGIQQSAIQ